MHVARETVVGARDADVDHRRAGLDHVGGDEVRDAHADDDDVRLASDRAEIRGSRVADRHRRVPAEQKVSDRLTDDLASADDGCMTALDLDAVLVEQHHHAGGCCRQEGRAAEVEAPGARRVEAVDVLALVDGREHPALVEVLRHGQLHEDPVDRVVCVQTLEHGEQIVVRSIGGKTFVVARHAGLGRRSVLVPDVDIGCRVVADEDGGEPDVPELANVVGHLGPDTRRRPGSGHENCRHRAGYVIAAMPTLTVVIPATNEPPTLAACLAAIEGADDGPEQVVVVTEGGGPAGARNDGALEATGDVLVFVDADVLPHADAFSRIRRAFGEDESLTAIFGSYDDAPPAAGPVSGFRNLLHHHVHQEGAGEATTFWAGLGAVRVGAFRAVGGFDAERYPLPSIEDIELGTRLVEAGGRIVLDPALLGTHLKAWTLETMIRTDFWQRGAPWAELVLSRGVDSAALNLGWRHRASALASVVVAVSILRGRKTATLGGLAALVALNAPFYELLARRRGGREAVIGVGLHALHHVTGAASVPVGIARHFRAERTTR